MNGGRTAVIEELIAPTFVSQSESMPAAGVEGFKQVVEMFRIAFPDIHLDVSHYVADGDYVVTWATVNGTHKGPLEGIPPTGKSVSVLDVDMWRVENGRITESWAHFDQAGLLRQLGVTMQEEH
jgi:steroid delta-isomerase-like uncharacterized protein